MKAALYARVSTTDKGQDVQMQLNDLRAYCKYKGYDYLEYIDEGISGSKEHRPELDRMMRDAENKVVDIIIVWKLDRLSRSLGHLIHTLNFFKEKKIDFVCTTQNIDTTTPTGKLMFHILGSFAEFERDTTIERVTAGMKHAKAHGTKSGKAIGKPIKYNKEDIIVMVQMLQEYRMSYGEIAKKLNIPKSSVYDAMKRIKNEH